MTSSGVTLQTGVHTPEPPPAGVLLPLPADTAAAAAAAATTAALTAGATTPPLPPTGVPMPEALLLATVTATEPLEAEALHRATVLPLLGVPLTGVLVPPLPGVDEATPARLHWLPIPPQ